ncbi:30S ribosomal protein S19e [Candidatus Woesearchaeota archaeon]|nr:30S ribosomal protein S19e [Candidatus Woesearchaeota archaeon]
MSVTKQELISAVSKELKPMLRKPEWADFVKTGAHKEKPPVDPDWWYMRAASIVLKVNDLGPIGVSKLRTKYGGRKNRGVAPDKFCRASGKVIRTLLQQLEKEGLLKQEAKGVHKGRVLTPKAKSMVIKASKQIAISKAKKGGDAQ